jgi:ribosome maturation factor RimP
LHGRIYLPIFFARATFLSLSTATRPAHEPIEPSPATPTSDAMNGIPVQPTARTDAIDVTVTGLGYDLVEVERLPRGLLRVTIDRVPGRVYGTPGEPDSGEFITVDDCERVTRQLQYALEVASLAYERLEVSSPGLDRLLKTEAHCQRFAGQAVSLTLKLPFQGRKHWTGTLLAREAGPEEGADGGGWRLVVADGKTESALDFRFDEARELRLVPVIDFKGRRRKSAPDEEKAAAPGADASLNGEQDR